MANPLTGGYHTRATTAGGSTTTLVIGALSGNGQEYVTVDEPWYLCNDGTNAGEYRRAVSFATITVTTGELFTNTVATDVSVDSYPYPPNLYTQAVNLALARIWRSCYRTVHGHLIPNGRYYALPRNMRAAIKIEQVGRQIVKDLFNRANSTTDPGPNWTAVSGDTAGVISEEFYFVTDADGDTVTKDVDLKNGFIKVTLRGTTNHETVYRIPAILFRMREDYAGAVDTTTTLVVRLIGTGAYVASPLSGGRVELRKNDGGTESVLASAAHTSVNGTNYVVEVEFKGTLIEVWVDDVQLISYTLLGGDLKYLDYPQMSFRLDKAGAPATAARIDSVYAYSLDSAIEWRDWENNDDELSLKLPAYGRRGPGSLLRVEGKQVLTALTADTTAGALAADTTAVLEISATEPAYRKLVNVAAAELRRLVGDPEWEGHMKAALAMPGMRSTTSSFKGPM